MNTHDRFDELLTGHLRADAPRQAPAGLLDAAMTRIAATPQRGGWLKGPTGRLFAAAAVLLVAVLAGTQLAVLLGRQAGTDPSPSATVVPSASEEPSATVGPSPSAPQPTESPVAADGLLLRVVSMGGGPTDPASLLPWATLMADGTLIWQPASAQTEINGFVTRTLTPDGLAELREHIFGSGLLDADASHELEPQPGAEPPGRGVSVHAFTVGDGDDPVVVTSVQWLGDDEEATYYQPSPERLELDTLARQLRDPESLLGADAWADPAAPYEALSYQLVLTPYRDVPPYGNPDASEVPFPFDEPLDEFGVESGDSRSPAFRCDAISRDEAAQIVDAVTAMGSAITNSVGLDRATLVSLDWAEGNGVVDLYLLPRMPDGFPLCEDQL